MSDIQAAQDLEIVSEDRPHAERSASQLPKLALCAGYKPGKGGKRTHWVTAQGLRGHHALETNDTSELESEHEEELVQICADYVNRFTAGADVDLREPRVETIQGRWGYLDRILVYREARKARLFDYKFVIKREPDDAEVNLQGFDYVVGFLESPEWKDIDEVEVHFIAPRFGSVTTATFTREDLPRLKLDILSILSRAKATDRKRAAVDRFTPDYDVCRFCDRIGNCPAITKHAVVVHDRYVSTPVPLVPANVHSSQANDPKTLGQLLTIANVLEGWCQSVKAHAAETAKFDGIIAEGYELTYRKGQRRVTDPVALITVARKHGVTIDDILANAKVSLPALESIVKSKAPRGTKAAKALEFTHDLRDVDAFERLEDIPFLQRLQPPAIALP